MRKDRMITRTVVTTKVTYTYADVPAQEFKEGEYDLPFKAKDAGKAMAALKALVENDDCKVIRIIDMEYVGTRYGMSEQAFVEHATKL